MSRDMREVDLVEQDERPGSPAPRPVRRRPPWPWLAGGALALVATLVMLQTAVDARRRLAEDRGERTVLAVPAPERALPTAWRLDGAAAGAVRVDGSLVGASVVADGLEVVGIDPATGTHTWSVKVRARTALETGGAECAQLPEGGDAPTRVVCLSGRADPTTPGVAQVVVVDVETRAPVGTWTTDVQAWGPVGDLVVTALPDDDGSTVGWTLTARTATGDVAWRTTTSRAAPPPPSAVDGPGMGGPSFGRLVGTDRWLAITDRGHAWVVAADGTVLDDRAIDGGFVTTTRGGEPVLSESPLQPLPTSRVRTDGQDRTVPGFPLTPVPDDGSAPGVDLWTTADGSGLVARDRTGDELWHDDEAAGARGTVSVAHGVVYVVVQDGVRAYSAADGTMLWRAPLAGVSDLMVDRDGHVLAAAGTNGTVLAMDPRTGRALWRADARDALPPGSPDDDVFVGTWRGQVYLAIREDMWVIG